METCMKDTRQNRERGFVGIVGATGPRSRRGLQLVWDVMADARRLLHERWAMNVVGCALVLGGLGCSTSDEVVSSEDELVGEHFPASHCEVFVDRAAPYFTSHGVQQMTLYMKTPLEKLASRGGVKAVGFHSQEINNGSAGPFRDLAAQSLGGAGDYWALSLPIASDFTADTTHIGAFYVEAGDGTRLWVNATGDDRDFVIDSNMVTNLARLRSPGYFVTGGGDPNRAVVTADEFPYLNPSGCR